MDNTGAHLAGHLYCMRLDQQATLNMHDNGHRIVVLEAGSDINEFERFVGRQFRIRLQYYMLSTRTRSLEAILELTSRSTHFLLYHYNRLIAVLRATPFPFEWSSLAIDNIEPVRRLSRYVEFSRLITDSQNRASQSVKCLLSAATEWAIRREYLGVTALCRPPQRRLFERLGLTPATATTLRIEQRARGDYWLMAADWQQILASVQQSELTNSQRHDHELVRQF